MSGSGWLVTRWPELRLVNHVNDSSPRDTNGLARALVSMVRQPDDKQRKSEELEAKLPRDLFVMSPREVVQWTTENCGNILTSYLLLRAKSARIDSSIPTGIILDSTARGPNSYLASYPPQPLRLDPQSVRGSQLGTWDEYIITLGNGRNGCAPNCVLIAGKWIDAGLVAADQMFPGFDQMSGSGSTLLRRLVRREWRELGPEGMARLSETWQQHLAKLIPRQKVGAFTDFNDILTACFVFPQVAFTAGMGSYCRTCGEWGQYTDTGFHYLLEAAEYERNRLTCQEWLQEHFTGTLTSSDACGVCNGQMVEVACVVNGRMPIRLSFKPGAGWAGAYDLESWDDPFTFYYTSRCDSKTHPWTGEVEVLVLANGVHFWMWMKKRGLWFCYDGLVEGGLVKQKFIQTLNTQVKSPRTRIAWIIVKNVEVMDHHVDNNT